MFLDGDPCFRNIASNWFQNVISKVEGIMWSISLETHDNPTTSKIAYDVIKEVFSC